LYSMRIAYTIVLYGMRISSVVHVWVQ